MFAAIGLIAKANDKTSANTLSELETWLENNGIDVILSHSTIKNSADLIIVAGGDGTLLGVARDFVDANIPILGVNLGRLGFLTDVCLDDMISIIEQVLKGQFIKEKRALLLSNIQEDQQTISAHLAVNEVVIHRQQVAKMIEFEIYVNGIFTHSQRADGLIINTATGSTAYALSSGGPIIHPDVRAISLVPICPHTLSNRPFLVPENSEILIKLRNSEAIVSFDAQTNVQLSSAQSLVISQYNNHINLIHPKDYDFFNIVRSKLHWGGKR